ncbi:MAG: matrixin family metalloprotease, partial [Pirellulaceae bacterium]|nr:matrixin family metalloprotease [Pirellulaceae bacterium]
MDTATRRNRLRRAILETLERRELMAFDLVKAAFAPNTSAEYRAAWNAQNNLYEGTSTSSASGSSDEGTILPFNLSSFRWTNPTGGVSPAPGDPATISWSIVPDGTLNSRDGLNSNLISFMDSIYGGGTGPVANRPWFSLFSRAYDRWAQETGLTFVYEAADDGLPYGASNNRGVTGVRGDVRIGGNRIDGDFGTLAYAFLPSNGGNSGFDGDMVIDTTDRFYRDNANAPTGENRALLNTLMHETGHSIGLGHVVPVDGTKLMEPNVSLNFFGPQHDDILGGHALYGDDKERNSTTATATDLGDLANGTTVISNVSVTNSSDIDWYKLRIPAAGRITINASPVGQTYVVGPDPGPTATVNTLLNSDLNLQLVAVDGTVLASVNNGGVGLNETITNLQLPSGGQYFIRVAGLGANPQLYNLSVTLAGIVTSTATVTGPRLLSGAPNSGEIFNFNQVNVLNASPTELVLRFDGSSDLNLSTLARGIRVTRAGRDGLFGQANDRVIVPGFLGFGDNSRIVVLRFAETLPD